MQEQAQATHWAVEILQNNWYWIAPIVSAILLGIVDMIFHKLPVKHQSLFKRGYDLIVVKLQKKK